MSYISAWSNGPDSLRHCIPGSSVKHSSCLSLAGASPLFEEEGGAVVLALFSNITHPIRMHRTSSGSGFSADNHPVNASQIQHQRTQKWFAAQKAHVRLYLPQ